MKKTIRKILPVFVILAMLLANVPAGTVQAVSPNIVISQIYGGGGNSGGVYTNDFIELYNRGSETVSVDGWSVQYASATGTGNFGSSAAQITPLYGSIAPGQYLLIQELAGSTVISPLPTPDVTDATPIAMSGTGGKVVLVNIATTLGCNGSSTPCNADQLARIIDLVGWDGANFYETTGVAGTGPAPATTNPTGVARNNGGCVDTDNNSADFTLVTPVARNSASELHSCNSPTNPSGIGAATPNAVFAGETSLLTMAVTPGTFPASTGLAVTCDLSAIAGSATQSFSDDGSNGDLTSADLTFSYSATVDASTTYGAKSFACTITDAQSRSGSASIALTVKAPPISIHDVQGAGHISPSKNQTITLLPAVVTALRTSGTRGFYVQNADADTDADEATSEGVFVYTGSTNPATLVAVGDLVQVSAKVSEYRAAAVGLTLTELVAPYTVTVISSGNPLPAPIVIGTGGRIPPSVVIEDDATGSVETTGTFDPANDGIDFYESMEGMLVQVNDAVAVGPTSNFTSNREIPVVGDNGANAVTRTNRGGVIALETDFNPERIILNDWIAGGPILPATNVNDSFPGATLGVIDYAYNNFKLQVISMPALVSGGLTQEVGPIAETNQISLAAFNVENLAPGDAASKYETLADLVINHLNSPDILSIEEIQDNNGTTNDGTVDASVTWTMLINAIQTAGGPVYDYRQIDPVNAEDGGAPGGNIRVGFLFRTDRGVTFIDRPGADATTANGITGTGNDTQLLYSPGRIDPTNTAFDDSRKPLAGEFMYNGFHLFVIANHWNSKSGDQPLFGVNQPPVFNSEIQRNLQATVVHDFVASILAADSDANVVMMGDLNDFQFSTALQTLKGSPEILTDMIETLPTEERYSYVYEGNSETLDHILVSDAVFARPYVYDVVHVNSEFAGQVSDHEPQSMVVTFINEAPTVDAGGPYNVIEGQTVEVSATGSDAEEMPLTYAWDLDNDGVFETPGQTVTFSAEFLSAPASYEIQVQVTDAVGQTSTDFATVNVIYNFGGFINPIPTMSYASGASIPVIFSLNADKGLDILVEGSPSFARADCTTGEIMGDFMSIETPGASKLSYDSATGLYQYVWKTVKAWKGTCRILQLDFVDGMTYSTIVKFK